MSELVSVILPTYNRVHSLGRAIRSVLAQTYGNLELIVVDDGSSDGSESLVAQISSIDRRVRYQRQPQRAGVAAARNAGIRAARGSLVAFQDSDDEWLVTKLQKQLSVLVAEPDVGVSFCGFIILHGDEPPRYCGPDSRMQQATRWPADALYEAPFITPTWLVRRELLERTGLFDESMPNLEDWELGFRLHDACGFRVVDEPLVVKYSSGDSHDTNTPARLASFERIVEKHGDKWRHMPQVMKRHWHQIGRMRLQLGQAGGHRALWHAWRLQPSQPRPAILSVATMVGGDRVYRGLKSLLRKKPK